VFETKRTFHHDLYNPNALLETQEAYSGLLSTVFDAQESQTLADFTAEGEDGPMFVDAFCNHALFLSIQAHRNGSDA
jgi:hypothetical protein